MTSGPPRLALVGPGFPFRSGIAYYTHQLADHLVQRDDIESMWVALERQYPAALFPGQSDRQDDGILASLRSPDLRWDPWSPWSAGAVADRIVQFGADAVVLPWWTWFWAASDGLLLRALRKRGVERWLAIVHNVSDHESAWWKSRLAASVLDQMSGFVAHSRAVSEPLGRLFPGRPIAISPLPLHELPGDRRAPRREARARLDLPEDDPVFLFFGLIRPYKGLDVLLEAWPRIHAETGGKLLIAGEVWPGCRELVPRIKSLAGVAFHDQFIRDDEVVDYFRAANLVILPYRQVTGTGIVPIATWFGRPVLASDLLGLRDVISEGSGLLFPAGDPTALAMKTIEFVRRSQEEALVEGVEGGSSRFSWPLYIDRVVALVGGASDARPDPLRRSLPRSGDSL